MREDELDHPRYVISVAATLAGVHPQTLRIYERKELIKPSRSSGRIRLYSEREVILVQEIQHLTQELGINLEGVRMILAMRDDVTAQESELREAERLIEEVRDLHRQELRRLLDRVSPNIVLRPKTAPAVIVRRRDENGTG